MRFFDTNILVYAATSQEPHKADIARELIQHALEVNHDGVISVQVMTEFANVMKTRFNAAATEDRKSTRLNSSHPTTSRMPSSA